MEGNGLFNLNCSFKYYTSNILNLIYLKANMKISKYLVFYNRLKQRNKMYLKSFN